MRTAELRKRAELVFEVEYCHSTVLQSHHLIYTVIPFRAMVLPTTVARTAAAQSRCVNVAGYEAVKLPVGHVSTKAFRIV